MFTETIEYDVPQVEKLAAKFAKSANIRDDGKTIEVGHYVAKKKGIWLSLLFATGARWQVHTEGSTPSLKKGNRILYPDISQENIVNALARLEARDNVSKEDKDAALRQALHDKLCSLQANRPQFK